MLNGYLVFTGKGFPDIMFLIKMTPNRSIVGTGVGMRCSFPRLHTNEPNMALAFLMGIFRMSRTYIQVLHLEGYFQFPRASYSVEHITLIVSSLSPF